MQLRASKDWRKLKSRADGFVRTAQTRQDMLPEQVCRWFYKFLMKKWNEQNFGVALDPAYLAWKKRMGLSTKMLISSGRYRDSIQVGKDADGWYCGVPVTATYENGTPVGTVARILEYGSPIVGIPPRPLWRSTLRQFRAVLPMLINQELLNDN